MGSKPIVPPSTSTPTSSLLMPKPGFAETGYAGITPQAGPDHGSSQIMLAVWPDHTSHTNWGGARSDEEKRIAVSAVTVHHYCSSRFP